MRLHRALGLTLMVLILIGAAWYAFRPAPPPRATPPSRRADPPESRTVAEQPPERLSAHEGQARREVLAPQADDETAVELEGGAVDEAGTPVPDVSVRVAAVPELGCPQFFETTTDARGRIRLTVPRAVIYRVSAATDHRALRSWSGGVRVDGRSPAPFTLTVRRVERGGIEGRVFVDPGYEAIHLIFIDAMSRRWMGHIRPDDDGSFAFDGLDPGAYRVQVQGQSDDGILELLATSADVAVTAGTRTVVVVNANR